MTGVKVEHISSIVLHHTMLNWLYWYQADYKFEADVWTKRLSRTGIEKPLQGWPLLGPAINYEVTDEKVKLLTDDCPH